MSEDDRTRADGYAEIDQNFATNVRERREEAQLSQEALAQRMIDRGFGFSQATIWKIEQGKRPVKISEAAALADALGLFGLSSLAVAPSTARHQARLNRSNRRAFNAYEEVKRAATAYLEAQVAVAFDAFEAREAGLAIDERWTSWLTIPAEQAAIEARIAYDQEDTLRERFDDTVSAIMTSLRAKGFDPVIDLDTIERSGGDSDAADQAAPAADAAVRANRGGQEP